MNYRHAYHAGNHADVLKHIVLTAVIGKLKAKETPFAVLDAHAGIGLYDLSGVEAGKTFEWEGGIGKLTGDRKNWNSDAMAAYFAAVDAINPRGRLRYYPGSPALAAHLVRPQDSLIFNELNPEDHKLLQQCFTGNRQARVTKKDALVAIKSELPLKPRRGLVLIDPPYEQADEFEQVNRQVSEGLRRMATAVFVVWYPIKDMTPVEKFRPVLPQRNVLGAELLVREPSAHGGLAGSGVIIINPPWQLRDELEEIVPRLAQVLGLGNWGRGTVNWLAPPK